MSKTQEELENAAILDISLIVHNDGEWFAAKKAWLAGYKAAMEQVADASKVMADRVGLEPTTTRLTVADSTD